MKPRSLSQRLAAWREDARHQLEAEWRHTRGLKKWHEKHSSDDLDILERELEPVEYRAAADRSLSLEDFVSLLRVDPASIRWDGKTLAHAAAKVGDLEKLRWLVENGVDPDRCDRHGDTPFTLAAWNPHECVVRYLISLGVNLNTQPKHRCSALMSCLGSAHFDMAQELIAAGADLQRCSFSPLHQAAAWGDKAAILSAAAEAKDLEIEDRFRRTPWLVAVHAGRIDAAACLRDLGAETFVSTFSGETAMHFAARGNHPKMIRYLFAAGHSIAPESGFRGTAGTPFGTAVGYDSVAAAKTLLRLGSRLRPQEPAVNDVIIEAKSAAMFELLHRYGANLNFIDHLGYWPLKSMAETGNLACAEWLLDHGAAVDNCQDYSGETALFTAANHSYLEVARLLLERGANPNAVQMDDYTPLSWSVTPGMKNLLLSYGAKAEPWK